MYLVGKRRKRKAPLATSLFVSILSVWWLNAFDSAKPGRDAYREVWSQNQSEFYDGEKCEDIKDFIVVVLTGRTCWDIEPEERARIEYEAKLAQIETNKQK